jgi:hypothetical protein
MSTAGIGSSLWMDDVGGDDWGVMVLLLLYPSSMSSNVSSALANTHSALWSFFSHVWMICYGLGSIYNAFYTTMNRAILMTWDNIGG